MKTILALFFALVLQAQTQTIAFHPLHVSSAGILLDDTGHPVALRGLNRSATGYGNADAAATDQDYAQQNQLLSMNLVRIFVNAAWWNNNVQVPIANMQYQTYIDQLIQRAKKYGNYVLILKAGQFPDAPCGADGKNCPASNQGDLNCQANSSLCASQDTTGTNIDTAFSFWAAFAKKYAADPAILYDTWEDMHNIDLNTWSNDQNQLIAAIRTYSPQSVIFVEDVPKAFEGIAAGTLADFAWSNIVWNFHLFTSSTGTCVEPASARYNNWPQNFDPLVTYAQKNGHAAAISEWGGCNNPEPYNTNITSYAKTHAIALAYFDSGNLITKTGNNYQLTPMGKQAATAYTAIANGGPGAITNSNSANGNPTLAPEAIASAFGAGLATTTQSATVVPLSTNLAGTSVAVQDVNGVVRFAELFYVSQTQVNYQVPPGVAPGAASITVTVNGDPVAFGTAAIAAIAPGIYTANSNGSGAPAAIVLTIHSNGTSAFVYTFQCPSSGNCTPLPIDLGQASDQVVLELYGTGIRSHTTPVTAKIGSTTLTASYAGPQGGFVGLDQINIVLPRSLAGNGTVNLQLIVDGQAANTVTLNFK